MWRGAACWGLWSRRWCPVPRGPSRDAARRSAAEPAGEVRCAGRCSKSAVHGRMGAGGRGESTLLHPRCVPHHSDIRRRVPVFLVIAYLNHTLNLLPSADVRLWWLMPSGQLWSSSWSITWTKSSLGNCPCSSPHQYLITGWTSTVQSKIHSVLHTQ